MKLQRCSRSQYLLGLSMFDGHVVHAQDRDALEVQKARNAHVQSRRNLIDYPADQFDLRALPPYKPQQQVTGVIRMTGSNYIADSPCGRVLGEGLPEGAAGRHLSVRPEDPVVRGVCAVSQRRRCGPVTQDHL